jgi:hypothetical protein
LQEAFTYQKELQFTVQILSLNFPSGSSIMQESFLYDNNFSSLLKYSVLTSQKSNINAIFSFYAKMEHRCWEGLDFVPENLL